MHCDGLRGGPNIVKQETNLLSDRKMFLDQVPAVRLIQTKACQWVELPARVHELVVKTLSQSLPELFNPQARQHTFLHCAAAPRELHILPGTLSPAQETEALHAAAMKRGI
jgi:hypothetical protein